MKVSIGNKEYTLTYSFASFNYMEDVDISEISDRTPFKSVRVLKDMFYGAMNFDEDIVVDRKTSDKLCEQYVKDVGIAEAIRALLEELMATGFFKSAEPEE